jgi:NADPH:quinone reductase
VNKVNLEIIKMRAVGFMKYGGPEVLEIYNLPEIHAGPGQLRIRNDAATVNPADSMTRSGMLLEQQKGIARLTFLEWEPPGLSMKSEKV